MTVFRRRRSADVGRDWDTEPDGPQDSDEESYGEFYDDEPAEDEEPAGVPRAEGGPWDAAEPYPARERVDLGCLQVPVGTDHEIQLVMADQQGAWVTVKHGESEMQVQAFAAARRGALWDDVRGEIADEVDRAGGKSEETQGSFGIELTAEVPAEPGQQESGLRRVRFVGIDGPRWFLRGLFAGAAAADPAAAGPLEAVFREVVVVRGDQPIPPRDLLELRLPPEAAAALEEQARTQQQAQQDAQQEGNRFATAPNPFDRGPEMTETRLLRGQRPPSFDPPEAG
jgi:hypothetical protein